MPDAFDDIFTELATISATQALLAERVTLLEDRPLPRPDNTEPSPGAPILWHTLPPAQRAELWPRFVTWVTWLADRYELTTDQLPGACWWRHGAVVEELTALWTSHQSTHAPDQDAGAAPHLWHDALARTLDRLTHHWLGPCRNGHHKPRHRTPWHDDDTQANELPSVNDSPCP
ncbi:hypothetical protein ACTWP5_31265 [Streptomyces sp. 4N509B]|uniref:hypothetical protein n=1 Tax=Streptomyces sp. 4N509B TaxID=3457413 RepID=UPI003FD0F872